MSTLSRLNLINDENDDERRNVFSTLSLGNENRVRRNPFARLRSLSTIESNVNSRDSVSVGWHTLVQHLNIQIEEHQRNSQFDLNRRRVSSIDQTERPTTTTDDHHRHHLSLKLNKNLTASYKTKQDDFQEETLDEKDFLTTDIHLIPIEELAERLNSNLEEGLTVETIRQHRNQYGFNKLTAPPKPSFLWMFIKQSFIGFNGILWIATLFAFLSYKPFGEPNPDITNLGLGIVLMLVILSNALFNFYQEVKSLKIVASFMNMRATLVNVKRNTFDLQINAEELVPGDIIYLKIGDRIPADCRLIKCENLQVNLSELTGESEPVHSTIKSTNLNFMETANLIFFSSFVVQGQGEAIVTHIGDATVLGKVNKLTRGTTQSELTGLHREINRFVLFVISAALTSVITIWITWSAWLNIKQHGYITLNANVVNSIGMIVAFIPEGLPAAVTLVLTIVAKKMYQEKVLVKSLATVETFNTVSIIATDKTGTLTLNRMTITALLWGSNEEYLIPIHSNDEQTKSSSILNDQDSSMKDLLIGACLCNNAKKQQSNQDLELIGDAADVALYRLAFDKFAIDIENIRNRFQRINSLPFNSKNKFMITANLIDQGKNVLILMKGAPDFVFSKCSTYKSDHSNQQLPIDQHFIRLIEKRQENLGKSGYRVIALIQQILSKNVYDQLIKEAKERNENDLNGLPNENYCFIGMYSLLDPAREGVPDAILKAHRAQIRVAMVTGDHPTTASAIAKKVNIFSQEISLTNGIDTFQIERNQQTGETIANFIRNSQTIIEKHHIGELTKSIRSLSIHILNKRKSKKKNFFEKIYSKLSFYFSDPNQMKDIEKAELIPYGVIVNGSDMHLMDDHMWDWVLSHRELIFARTSPEQKLRLVLELTKRGEIVAVTGDGTNDAPALKQAHLGVAMAGGTDVSKEAADIILLDNNFSSIIQSIETGRLLSDNLKKVAIYLLPGGSWSEVLPVFFTIWLGIPLSLSAFLAIVFCMLNDVVNSLAMVSEKAEQDIMSRPPAIRHKTHLLDWKLLFYAYLILGNIETFSSFFGFFWFYQSQGIPLDHIFFTYANYSIDPPINKTRDELDEIQQTGQCIYYVSLCIMQFFNLLSTRTRYASFFSQNPFYGKTKNLKIFYGIFFSTFVCLFITLIPWFHSIFKTKPVPVLFVCPAIFLGFTLFLFDESRKFLIRRYPNSFLAKIAW